jgi:predicted DNA-binding WGR domain protein
MKKHLTFKDNKSDKFWSIAVSGKSFTVTYGKTGTDGQTSVKDFDTEEKCMKEAEKLVSEKIKKEYIESSGTHKKTKSTQKGEIHQINKTTNIIDSTAERKYIHFAKEHEGHLYTIQEDNILSIWKIEHSFELSKVSSITLPFNFCRPQFQLTDQNLLLKNPAKAVVIISLQDKKKPVCIFQEVVEGLEASCLVKGKLYHQTKNGFHISLIPAPANSVNSLKLVILQANNWSKHTLIVNDIIYWIGQQTIIVMDISDPMSPTIIAEKKLLDVVIGYPVKLSKNRMAVLEVYDDIRIAVNFFDLSGNNVKRAAKGLLKNNRVTGFSLMNDVLYITHLDYKKIASERKYKTYLSKIDLTDAPAIVFTVELPFIEKDGDGSSQIVWSRVNGNVLGVLLGNGDVHRLSIN